MLLLLLLLRLLAAIVCTFINESAKNVCYVFTRSCRTHVCWPVLFTDESPPPPSSELILMSTRQSKSTNLGKMSANNNNNNNKNAARTESTIVYCFEFNSNIRTFFLEQLLAKVLALLEEQLGE